MPDAGEEGGSFLEWQWPSDRLVTQQMKRNTKTAEKRKERRAAIEGKGQEDGRADKWRANPEAILRVWSLLSGEKEGITGYRYLGENAGKKKRSGKGRE